MSQLRSTLPGNAPVQTLSSKVTSVDQCVAVTFRLLHAPPVAIGQIVEFLRRFHTQFFLIIDLTISAGIPSRSQPRSRIPIAHPIMVESRQWASSSDITWRSRTQCDRK